MNIMNVTPADEEAALKTLSDMEAGIASAEAPAADESVVAPPAETATVEQPAAVEEEIRIVDTPTPPEPEPRENRPAKVSGDPESRIRQLVWEREQEKRRAEQAQYQAKIAADRERALMAVTQALKNKLDATSSDNHAVTVGAKQIMEQRAAESMAAAKAAFAEAAANGDTAKMTEAMERMAEAKVDASRVQEIRLPEAPVRPAEILQFEQIEQAFQQQQQQQSTPAPLPQPYQEWRSRNAWYTTDPVHPLRNLSLHAEMVSGMIASEGKPPDTAEHFAELNARMQPVLSQFFGGSATPTPQPQAQVVPPAPAPSLPQQQTRIPVAPVGAPRVPTQQPRSNAREVTAVEAAIAKQFGVTLNDYVQGLKGIPIK